MLGDLPAWLESTAQLAAALTVIATAFTLLVWKGPGRFVWRAILANVTAWNKRAAIEALNEKINGDLDHLQQSIAEAVQAALRLERQMEDLQRDHVAIMEWIEQHTTWSEGLVDELGSVRENFAERMSALEQAELRRREEGG